MGSFVNFGIHINVSKAKGSRIINKYVILENHSVRTQVRLLFTHSFKYVRSEMGSSVFVIFGRFLFLVMLFISFPSTAAHLAKRHIVREIPATRDLAFKTQ